jgi:hypothetical protein
MAAKFRSPEKEIEDVKVYDVTITVQVTDEAALYAAAKKATKRDMTKAEFEADRLHSDVGPPDPILADLLNACDWYTGPPGSKVLGMDARPADQSRRHRYFVDDDGAVRWPGEAAAGGV